MLSGDYAIGLMTIITGLAIADMVASMHGLLMNRQRVRWDWLAMLAAAYIFMLIVSSWGISYRNVGNQQINPLLWSFALWLAQIIPLYLAARASLPDSVGEDGADLASHYTGISRYFWASIAFTYALFVAYAAYGMGLQAVLGRYWSPAIQLLMMLVLIAVQNRRIHAILVPIIVLLFSYDHVTRPMFG